MALLISLFTLISFSAFGGVADSCDTPIDLRVSGGPLDGLGSVAQGYSKSNLCGFFTFSQFLDSYRVSRKNSRGSELVRSSAIAVGVENAIRRNLPFWVPIQNSTDPLSLRLGRWGSTFCALAESAKELGYCVDPSLPTLTVDETAKFSDITTFVYGKLQKIAETPVWNRNEVISKEIDGIYSRYVSWGLERSIALLEQSQLRSFIEKNASKPYVIIQEVFLKNCVLDRNRSNDLAFDSCESEFYVGFDITGIPLPNEDPLRTDRAGKRIHGLLDSKSPLPIPFAYCSRVLIEGKKYDGASPIGTGCGIHWSLIAGRKKVAGECFLLVRNSWRPGVEYSSDWVVEKGDIWVREKELLRSMLLAQWLRE